jgi:hypothetical protein
VHTDLMAAVEFHWTYVAAACEEPARSEDS